MRAKLTWIEQTKRHDDTPIASSEMEIYIFDRDTGGPQIAVVPGGVLEFTTEPLVPSTPGSRHEWIVRVHDLVSGKFSSDVATDVTIPADPPPPPVFADPRPVVNIQSTLIPD